MGHGHVDLFQVELHLIMDDDRWRHPDRLARRIGDTERLDLESMRDVLLADVDPRLVGRLGQRRDEASVDVELDGRHRLRRGHTGFEVNLAEDRLGGGALDRYRDLLCGDLLRDDRKGGDQDHDRQGHRHKPRDCSLPHPRISPAVVIRRG